MNTLTDPNSAEHLDEARLQAGLEAIRRAPAREGSLELIVRRPRVDEREVLGEGRLDPAEGLVGDMWRVRPSSRTPDQSPHPDMQLNIMNARAIALFAGDRARWALAGDQLYLDFDLSEANLPPGTRVAIGEAVIEITAEPHTGCAKFQRRYGAAVLRFVNSPVGRQLRLRGLNAKVVQPGTIRTGDAVRKLAA